MMTRHKAYIHKNSYASSLLVFLGASTSEVCAFVRLWAPSATVCSSSGPTCAVIGVNGHGLTDGARRTAAVADEVTENTNSPGRVFMSDVHEVVTADVSVVSNVQQGVYPPAPHTHNWCYTGYSTRAGHEIFNRDVTRRNGGHAANDPALWSWK